MPSLPLLRLSVCNLTHIPGNRSRVIPSRGEATVSTFFVLQQDESSMLVLAFYRKPRVNPVLLALGIITHVREPIATKSRAAFSDACQVGLAQ